MTSLKSVIVEEKALGTRLPPKYISNQFFQPWLFTDKIFELVEIASKIFITAGYQ